MFEALNSTKISNQKFKNTHKKYFFFLLKTVDKRIRETNHIVVNVSNIHPNAKRRGNESGKKKKAFIFK